MRTYEPTQALIQKPRESRGLTLRALAAGDKEKVCLWIASPIIAHYSFVVLGPHSAARERNKKNYAERYFNILMTDPHRQTYAILWHKNIIGTIGIKDINGTSADCFIDIGEENFRGRGFGYEAMNQLLDIAFYSIGLFRLSLDVLEFNRAALKLYVNLGFETQKSVSWHYDEFGLYWRVLRMSVAKHRWLDRSN